MALAFPNDSEMVKQALMDELQNLLSCEKQQMDLAEARVKQLECTEGYGVYLAEIVMNQSYELPLRQMACITLTRYVEKNWHDYDQDGNRNERCIVIPSESAKRAIRNILPNGLYDPNSKIRSSVAHAISTISTLDDPVAWTDLFDIVIKCLSGNEDSIHGASLVLSDFNYDVKLIHEKGPTVVKEAFRVFRQELHYTIETRVGALRILKTLFTAVSALIIDPAEQAEMVKSILASFMTDFLVYLKIDNVGVSNSLMRAEIAKLLTFVAAEMPDNLQSYMPDIMPVVWQLLTHSADVYVKLTVNNSMENPLNFGDDEETSEYFQFHNMITQVLEFVNTVVSSQVMHNHIEPVLEDLIYITIVFMELTREQIYIWNLAPNKYVEDEDDTGFEMTVRMCGKDLLLVLSEEYNNIVLPKLQGAMLSHFAVAEQEMENGNENWWKIHEACMVAVYIFRNIILESSSGFDLVNYLKIVHSSLVREEAPFLVARALWTVSAFSKSELYDKDMFTNIFDITIANLQKEQLFVKRISAARAIYGFMQANSASEGEKRALVISKLSDFFNGIEDLLITTTGSSMLVLLESLTALMAFDFEFTSERIDRVTFHIESIFSTSTSDPFVMDALVDLLAVLCKQEKCLPATTKSVIGLLSRATIVNTGLITCNFRGIDTAVEMLTTVVKHSKPPLAKELIENGFPLLINLMKNTDDHTCLVECGECLRAFIQTAPKEIANAMGGKALSSIMEVTIMLLNPLQNEMNAGQVGRLVITIIRKLGELFSSSDIDLLLKAVISKMQLVESLKVIMSLIVIFAHLFLTNMEAAINFLTTIPDPTGESALKYVLCIWVTKQSCFFGAYERKVTTMALCKILEYSLTTNDHRLVDMMSTELSESPNDEVTEGVRRRSQYTKSWTNLPVLVLIFKALINELFHLKEAKNAEDLSSDDDENSGGNAECRTVNSFYVSDLYYKDDEEKEEDDEMLKELLEDPQFHDLEKSVSDFMLTFSNHQHYPAFCRLLRQSERDILDLLIPPTIAD